MKLYQQTLKFIKTFVKWNPQKEFFLVKNALNSELLLLCSYSSPYSGLHVWFIHTSNLRSCYIIFIVSKEYRCFQPILGILQLPWHMFYPWIASNYPLDTINYAWKWQTYPFDMVNIPPGHYKFSSRFPKHFTP